MSSSGENERLLAQVALLPGLMSTLLWATALVFSTHTGAVDWGGARSSVHGPLCALCDIVFHVTIKTEGKWERKIG